MQYRSATILLHRPTAGFGTPSSHLTASNPSSRSTCVASAAQIARFLQDYDEHHGNASTMSGVALHTISTAATTLIAEIAERKGSEDTSQLFSCLRRCIRSLAELEKSYRVARRVRKISQLVMRLCNLDGPIGGQSDGGGGKAVVVDKPPIELHDHGGGGGGGEQSVYQTVYPVSTTATSASLANYPPDLLPDMSLLEHDLYSVDDVLPTTSQFDILYSFESFFGNS